MQRNFIEAEAVGTTGTTRKTAEDLQLFHKVTPIVLPLKNRVFQQYYRRYSQSKKMLLKFVATSNKITNFN